MALLLGANLRWISFLSSGFKNFYPRNPTETGDKNWHNVSDYCLLYQFQIFSYNAVSHCEEAEIFLNYYQTPLKVTIS